MLTRAHFWIIVARMAQVRLIHEDETQNKSTAMAYRGGEKAGGATTLALWQWME